MCDHTQCNIEKLHCVSVTCILVGLEAWSFHYQKHHQSFIGPVASTGFQLLTSFSVHPFRTVRIIFCFVDFLVWFSIIRPPNQSKSSPNITKHHQPSPNITQTSSSMNHQFHQHLTTINHSSTIHKHHLLHVIRGSQFFEAKGAAHAEFRLQKAEATGDHEISMKSWQ